MSGLAQKEGPVGRITVIDTLNRIVYPISATDTIYGSYDQLEWQKEFEHAVTCEKSTDYFKLGYDTSLIIVHDMWFDINANKKVLAPGFDYVAGIVAEIAYSKRNFEILQFDLLVLNKKQKTIWETPNIGRAYDQGFRRFLTVDKNYKRIDKIVFRNVWLRDDSGRVILLRRTFPGPPKYCP